MSLHNLSSLSLSDQENTLKSIPIAIWNSINSLSAVLSDRIEKWPDGLTRASATGIFLLVFEDRILPIPPVRAGPVEVETSEIMRRVD